MADSQVIPKTPNPGFIHTKVLPLRITVSRIWDIIDNCIHSMISGAKGIPNIVRQPGSSHGGNGGLPLIQLPTNTKEPRGLKTFLQFHAPEKYLDSTENQGGDWCNCTWVKLNPDTGDDTSVTQGLREATYTEGSLVSEISIERNGLVFRYTLTRFVSENKTLPAIWLVRRYQKKDISGGTKKYTIETLVFYASHQWMPIIDANYLSSLQEFEDIVDYHSNNLEKTIHTTQKQFLEDSSKQHYQILHYLLWIKTNQDSFIKTINNLTNDIRSLKKEEEHPPKKRGWLRR